MPNVWAEGAQVRAPARTEELLSQETELLSKNARGWRRCVQLCK